MRFELSTELDCAPDEAVRHLRTPRLLAYVAAPLLRFEPVDPPALPAEWSPGRYRVRMRLLGFVPLGAQTIGLEIPEPPRGAFVLHDRGSSALVRTWDHRIEVAPAPGGRTRYRDRVEVEAGLATPLVWAFARAFFAHRQRRWRRLAASGFDYAR